MDTNFEHTLGRNETLMKKFFAAAISAVLLAGCGADAGSEYIGKWQDIKRENRTVQIEKNGDGLIVRETSPSFLDGKPKTQNLPAVVKDGMLQVNGQMTINLVIDKSTGHLTGPGMEYKKVN